MNRLTSTIFRSSRYANVNASLEGTLLHAPTSNKQQSNRANTNAPPHPEQGLRPRTLVESACESGAVGGLGLGSPLIYRRQQLARLHSTYGNQAVLRMFDRSRAAGGTPASQVEGVALQAKLAINQPGDVYEQEAARVADAVMRMPEPVRAQAPIGQIALAPSLQRKCACGGHGTECAACQEKQEETLQRAGAQPGAPEEAPPIVPEVLRSPGQPLDPATRAFFEQRFGRDFSHFRMHSDAHAAPSARAVGALAYAVGSHLAFAAGRYEPGTPAGRRLLAHHVVQQHNNGAGQHSSLLVQSAPSLKAGGVSPMLQRKLVIKPDGAATDIRFQMDFLCPGNFTLVPGRSPATIVPANPGSCTASGTQSCACLCDVTTDPNRTYEIGVHAANLFPDTEKLFDGTTAVIPGSDVFPATVVTQNPSITMPASGSGSIEFGVFQSNGRPVWASNWRILAHELCGHARLNQTAGGNRGNRPGHDTTINTENAIAAEHGAPARGHFNDPRQGESFFNVIGDRSKVVFPQRNGLHFELP